MKRLLDILLLIAVFAFPTSCGTVYYDTIPAEVATMTIPSEGGRFEFKVVDYEVADRTRFQPGEAFKCYCYRVVEDGVAGKESDRMTGDPNIWVEFAPNDTDHTKEYTIDVKVADDYYNVDESPNFGEWQTVWRITQLN
jgi:hypothetical protein